MARIGINIATGSLQKEEVIVGIDLGTTNSLVALVHPETRHATVLREHDSSSLVPSLLYFDPSGNIQVGEAARPFLDTEPSRTIFSVKRLLGKSLDQIESSGADLPYSIVKDEQSDTVKIAVGEPTYSPTELSAMILKELKQRAEHIVKTPVNRAVITVPAYFNDAQRQATREAGKLAGLEVLRIINEPTAASLAYGHGLDKTEEKTIVVYDLGGGTFDVSVLRLRQGVFDVLSTNGDTYLGGDDIDNLIVEFWRSQNNYVHAGDSNAQQSLRLAAEEAKKILSASEIYSAEVNGSVLKLSKSKLEELIQPLIDRTLECCRLALKDAGLRASQIDEVIMVGGSTRVPLVKTAVSKFFGRPVNDSLNPDEVVALGAAIQADVLAGNNKEILLLDITPLSLGIETAGGLMDVIIPRNAKIPSSAAREYTTQAEGQTGMRISVFQGERDLVADNRLLDHFILKGIPAMPAGMAKVRISFLINADGILTVKAKELRSGVEQSIEVKPLSGVDDATVEKMLEESMLHAEEDIQKRALAEAQTEAEQLLKTTERFLQKNAPQLVGTELAETAAAMQALQLAITLNDKELIQKKSDELNIVSRPYAERIMDAAISESMKGKKIQ